MEPLDWKVLREQCADDESLVREIVDLYRKEWAALLHDVQRAVAGKDLAASKRSAHRLKGAVLSLAAKPSAALAQQLEHAAAAGNQAEVERLLPRLEEELARLATALS